MIGQAPTSLYKRLVAHRGNPAEVTENTLESLQSALASGAAWVECDVRLSADRQPVLMHDATLERLAERPTAVSDLTLDQLRGIRIRDPSLADGARCHIASLAQALQTLAQFPDTQAMIEIKPEPVAELGPEVVMDAVMAAISPALDHAPTSHLFISYSRDLVAHLDGGFRSGWIVPEWNDENAAIATALQPDYLIINHTKVPAGVPLWPGPWHWVAYVADQTDDVRQLIARGFELVETNAIARLMKDLNKHG